MNTSQSSNAPLPRSNWWSRNWKWFVPTGCLTFLILLVAFGGSILIIVSSAMKSSDAYQTALAKAKSDSRVVAALGSPIKAGFLVSGSTHVTGPSGDADLAIPISGPNGKGTIYLTASKSAGKWTFSTLVVEVKETGERIDLAEAAKEED